MKKSKALLSTDVVDKNTEKEYHFSLEIYIFMQAGRYIAYCPALDLSTSAEDYNEAFSNFYEMFQLYVETCLEQGTLFEDLEAHGWKVQKMSIKPPKYTVLLKKPEMKNLMESNISFERVVTPARIPAFA